MFMVQNKCNLIAFDKEHNRTVLVKGTSLEYCEELVKQWIDNHPERYESYCIFIFNGIWDCKYRYERLTDVWFQKYELQECIKSKKSKEE